MLLRTIIADDHPVVLMGLRAALETTDIKVVGEAANGDQLLELLATRPCDAVVTDFSMPEGSHNGDGLLLLDAIRRKYPRLPIIVLTMVTNVAVLQTMRFRGANCLCDKRSPLREVVTALRNAAAGRGFISETIRREIEKTSVVDTFGDARLSSREIEVVRLYVGGMSITQIADRLSRSVKTVSRQKRDAMRKLGIDHDSRLSEYAREQGMSS